MRELSTVADGLFEKTADGPRLIGSRCTACASVYFPTAVSCRNPDCLPKTVEPCHLPHLGTLFSFTIQRYRPPALFRMDDWSPYALGLVDLGHGLQVMGMLTGVDPEALEIGMALSLVTETLFVDEQGAAVETYKFAPVAQELP